MTDAPLLAVHQARKRFGGVIALDDVDFELRAGEIHALLGENGAGKSTLVKLLAGVVSADDGEIRVGGEPLPHRFTPADVKNAGIAFVHQDLGLLDHLSVAENIALSTGYQHRAGRLISFGATERHVAGSLARLRLDIRADAPVRTLAQDEKVMVAVARAFSLDARGIVLDEVTSSLPAPEAARLADALRATRDAGLGIIFVTHRIDEIFGLADRVTVLRNGRRVATADVASTDHDQVVEWILGPEVAIAVQGDAAYRTRPIRPLGGPRLVVRDLRVAGLHEPVSFEVAEGEILGVCGSWAAAPGSSRRRWAARCPSRPDRRRWTAASYRSATRARCAAWAAPTSPGTARRPAASSTSACARTCSSAAAGARAGTRSCAARGRSERVRCAWRAASTSARTAASTSPSRR